MASQESEALKTLYRGWAAALAANPEMPLDELRLMFEHWGDVTAEPGGVDYIETNTGGVPAARSTWRTSATLHAYQRPLLFECGAGRGAAQDGSRGM